VIATSGASQGGDRQGFAEHENAFLLSWQCAPPGTGGAH